MAYGFSVRAADTGVRVESHSGICLRECHILNLQLFFRASLQRSPACFYYWYKYWYITLHGLVGTAVITAGSHATQGASSVGSDD